jgi:hypothetical protein
MANERTTIPYDPEDRLHEAITSFEQACDDGLNPDPAVWLARYSDVSDRLRKYFANQAGSKRRAEPLRPPSPVSGLPRPFGAYELLEEIGRGGMGVVYKARQVGLNRLVAVKMIRGGTHVGADALGRFRVEGKAIARLQHPNVVQIFEVGDLNGLPYFSLEFVDGSSLARKLAGEPQPPRYAAALVQAIARGIQAAHERGIVHRDLKPHNVLVTAGGTPKVTDFGLAKQLDDDLCQTQTGAVMGTPPYMAPEQAAGRTKEIGPSADVYGLGAILYEMLTGRPPFRGTSVSETLEQVIKSEAVPPRRLQPKVPRDLETICLKCLQKEPKQRYLTAGALADDLRRFLAGEPIQARPVGQGERLWRWCRRNPALAAALTVAVALLVGGTAVSSYFAVAEATQAETARKEKAEAVAARDALKESNAKLRQERDKSDTALARSLVRALTAQTTQPGQALPPTPVEIEALWELASQPGERVRLRFATEALQDPLFTRQLRNRAKLALHAAVGLDARQREVVEGLLLERLRHGAVSEEQRTDIALVAASLGNLSPRAAATAGQALIQAMSKTTDRLTLPELAQGLSAVAARLEPQEAASALIQAMTRTTDEGALWQLAQGLSAVAARLEAKDAAGVVSALTQAMSKAHPFAVPKLAQGLSAVAGRLEPKDAAQAASALSQAISKAQLFAVPKLAQGLSKVATRLEPKDAAQAASAIIQAMSSLGNRGALRELTQALSAVAARLDPEDIAQAARALTKAMSELGNPDIRRELTQALSAVAAHLEPKDAVQAASALSEAMSKATHPDALGRLAQELSVVAARLEPKEAAQQYARAASALSQAISKAHPFALRELAQGLSAVAGHLEPKDAARAASALSQALSGRNNDFALRELAQGLSAVAARLEPTDAAQAASALSQAMTKTSNPEHIRELAQGLSAVAARLEPQEAAQQCARAASALTRAMTNPSNAFYLRDLAQGLSAVAAHMEPKVAAQQWAQAASALSQAMSKSQHPDALALQAQGLSAVAARLEPKDAAQHCAQAAETITQAMSNTTDSNTLRQLAQGLTVVAAHLEPKEAAQPCARAASALSRAMTKTSTPLFLSQLAQGLSAVAARLEPTDAAQAASALSQAMSHATHPGILGQLAQELSATLTRDPRSLRVRAAGLVAALGVSDPQPLLAPPALALAQATLPCRLSTQQLTDLLKQPFCVGEARRVVLEQLERRFRRTFVDHWEFVRFAQQQNLGLDFTTPPRRPQALLPEARK